MVQSLLGVTVHDVKVFAPFFLHVGMPSEHVDSTSKNPHGDSKSTEIGQLPYVAQLETATTTEAPTKSAPRLT